MLTPQSVRKNVLQHKHEECSRVLDELNTLYRNGWYRGVPTFTRTYLPGLYKWYGLFNIFIFCLRNGLLCLRPQFYSVFTKSTHTNSRTRIVRPPPNVIRDRIHFYKTRRGLSNDQCEPIFPRSLRNFVRDFKFKLFSPQARLAPTRCYLQLTNRTDRIYTSTCAI